MTTPGVSIPIPGELGSRKFRAACYASALAMVGLYLKIPLRDIAVAISPLMLYIPSQGLADFGKEKVKGPATPEPPKA